MVRIRETLGVLGGDSAVAELLCEEVPDVLASVPLSIRNPVKPEDIVKLAKSLVSESTLSPPMVLLIRRLPVLKECSQAQCNE